MGSHQIRMQVRSLSFLSVVSTLSVLGLNPHSAFGKTASATKDSDVKVSAEVRWFWNEKPENLERWFLAGDKKKVIDSDPNAWYEGKSIELKEAEIRIDRYLYDPSQPKLGIKLRDTENESDRKWEVKGCLGNSGLSVDAGSLHGNVQFWSKWPSRVDLIKGSPSVVLKKTRCLRLFDTSKTPPEEIQVHFKNKENKRKRLDQGCGVEYTVIDIIKGQQKCATWYSFGFESFGSLENVEKSLDRTLDLVLQRGLPIVPGVSECASYPDWILRHCSDSSQPEERSKD